MFFDEMECIKVNKSLFKESKIINLNLFIDDYGLLWVGGRLCNVRLLVDECYLVIILGKYYIFLLFVWYFYK